MDTLYIIGNGFDRFHGLNTSYQSFAFFLQDNYAKIYDYLIRYYRLTDLDRQDNSSQFDPLWAEFEKALATLDFESVLDDNTDYLPNIGSDNFRDSDWHSYEIAMEQIVDDLTKNLFNAFKEFILAIKYPENIEDRRLLLKTDALYFNFNYTQTLEKFYSIPNANMVYIHEKASDDDTVLVLGHGVDPRGKKIVNSSSEDYDYSYESGKSELLSYYLRSFKKTEEIIQRNGPFFERLANIKTVFVLGHSLSDVDSPYIKRIQESVREDAQWVASVRKNEERESRIGRLVALGINKSFASAMLMDEFKLIDKS